jgi:hypothetical protein
MLHVFHLDVAKGSGVAYVAIATHVCFKCMLHKFCECMFQLPNVPAVLEAYYKCFIWMLQYSIFQEYTTYVVTVGRILQRR